MEAPVPIDHARRRLFTAVLPAGLAVLLLWMAFGVDKVYRMDLFRFGVLPRTAEGLLGILLSPFVHDDLEHLFNNSAPILVLGWLLVYFYPKAAWRVVLASWILGGAWVWITARDSYHIGASGIIYGMAAFLFFSGLLRRRIALMAVSLIVVFLYGSMVWGVLPLQARISWESHLFGAMAGVVVAWFYRHVPPAHVPPPIVLEDEPEAGPGDGAWTDVPDPDPPGPEGPSPRRGMGSLRDPWSGGAS